MSRVPSIRASLCVGLALLVSLAGCSSKSDDPIKPVQTPVTVGIIDPANGTIITSLVDGSDYELSYAAELFTVAAPGECDGKPAPCGHARAWVDDMACNDMTRSLDYNAEGASPIDIGFDYCPMPFLGAHDILLKLYTDDEKPFIDTATNAEVTATAHVTVTSIGASGSGGGGGTAGSGGQAGAP